MYDDNEALFDMEERDLMNDLRELPRNSAVRKINELVKRCRLAKVSCHNHSVALEIVDVLLEGWKGWLNVAFINMVCFGGVATPSVASFSDMSPLTRTFMFSLCREKFDGCIYYG